MNSNAIKFKNSVSQSHQLHFMWLVVTYWTTQTETIAIIMANSTEQPRYEGRTSNLFSLAGGLWRGREGSYPSIMAFDSKLLS